MEDEEVLSNVLVDRFKEEGLDVYLALDGELGLKMAKKIKPDLILLDIVMPVMDGMTMLKKLKASDWGKNIPIMILTNLSDEAKVAECEKQGVYDYLIKSDWKIDAVVKKVKSKL